MSNKNNLPFSPKGDIFSVSRREHHRDELAVSESKGRFKENAKFLQKETGNKVENLVRVRAGDSVTPGKTRALSRSWLEQKGERTVHTRLTRLSKSPERV